MSTAGSKGTKVPYRCSFCGKSRSQVRKLIAGPGVYICDACVDVCQEVIERSCEEKPRHVRTRRRSPNPSEFKNALDEYIIGQELPSATLSVAVYNHYKRAKAGQPGRRRRAPEEQRPPRGPDRLRQDAPRPDPRPRTGRALRDRRRDVADRGRLRGRGCREHPRAAPSGRGLRRERAADGHRLHRRDRQDRAQSGQPVDHPRRVGGRGPARPAQDPGRYHRERAATGRPQASAPGIHPIDTTNVLFICGGAFEGLERIIEERVGRRSMGFGAEGGFDLVERERVLEHLMPDALLKFGLIPEFVGRLPVTVTLSALTREDLMRVLTEPRNAVTRQFQKFLQLDKVDLVFTDGAIAAASELAQARKTGARALRSIVEESLLDVMYDIPERTDVRRCIITEETIRDGRAPLLLTKAEVDRGVDETNYESLRLERGA